MNQYRLRIALLLVILYLSPRSGGNACSVVEGYVRPTNYELVKEADAIVLANAVSFEKKGALRKGKAFGIFKFKVLERIKGECKDQIISIEGDDEIRSWGDPNDFSFTKADHGPCNPTDYEQKGNYILFLRNWKGKWLIGGSPFTRVNVLVEGANAPWSKAVRQYARIAILNDYEQEKLALRELQSRAIAGDPACPEALVQDIDSHFSKPTPAKSFSDLRAIYDHAKDQDTRELVLWACARDEKQDAKDFVRALIRSGEWLNLIAPICSYSARVSLDGFAGTFATAFGTNVNQHERRWMLIALGGSAQPTEQTLMENVLRSVTKEEARILGTWFVKHPTQEAINRFTEFASKDYFANHELTLTLAGMGDTNVLNWAKALVSRRSDKDWLGYYVFAVSPLPEADTLARQVIQRGDGDPLVWLVQGYADSIRPDRLERIKDTIGLKAKSRKLIYWLRRTLGDLASAGDKKAESLLKDLPIVESE